MVEITRPTLNEIKSVFKSEWGADFIVENGRFIKSYEVEGFIAKLKGKTLGLITYIIREEVVEIVTLNSLAPAKGIGTMLLNKVIEITKDAGRNKIFLVTTNDNIHAIGFYQKRNFRITNIRPDAVTESRKIKPEIPLYGKNGIQVRDEVEMQLVLE